MWGILIALAAAGGLVGLGATRLARRRWLDEVRLARLRASARRGDATLDMLEDGAVLARRAGFPDLAAEFKAAAAKMKRGRR